VLDGSLPVVLRRHSAIMVPSADQLLVAHLRQGGAVWGHAGGALLPALDVVCAQLPVRSIFWDAAQAHQCWCHPCMMQQQILLLISEGNARRGATALQAAGTRWPPGVVMPAGSQSWALLAACGL
jgi:hypothetical protein